MHITPAEARELAYLLGHAPRAEEAERRIWLITRLKAPSQDAA